MSIEFNLTIEQIKYNLKLLKKSNVISRSGSTKNGKWIVNLDN